MGKVTVSEEEVQKLLTQGYCRTSRKFGCISRIDRPDWKEYSKRKGFPIDADWYRRCVSKDKLEIGSDMGMRFPASSDAEVGYVEKDKK